MKIRKILHYSLRALIAIMIVVSLFLLGFWLNNYHQVFLAIFFPSLGLIVLSIVINLVLAIKYKKRYEKMNAKEMHAFVFDRKDTVEKNYHDESKKMDKYIKLSYIYFSFCIILLFILVFSFGVVSRLIPNDGEEDPIMLAIIVLILVTFILTDLLAIIMPSKTIALEKRSLLKATDYPALFNCVKRAALKAGINRSFHLYSSDVISIIEEGKDIIITVNIYETALLTYQEFYSIMLHEFAHFKNRDTNLSLKYRRFHDRWISDNHDFQNETRWRSVFLTFPMIVLHLHYETLLTFASMAFEVAADEFVKKEQCEQDFINALAKGTLLTLFNASCVTELQYWIYETKEPVKNYAEIYLKTFNKYLVREQEKWNFILRNMLPPRISTHPTFKQRMENLDCSYYNYETKETDESFISEQRKLISYLNNQIYQNTIKTYETERKQKYLQREKIIADYRARTEVSGPLTLNEVIDVTEALLGIDDLEAIKILEQYLEVKPDEAQVKLQLAVIYYYHFDAKCVDYAKEVIQLNPRFAEAARDIIGHYALNVGRQDLVDEYRAGMIEAAQTSINLEKELELKRFDKLEGHGFKEETMKQLWDFVSTKADGKLRAIYGVKKVGKEIYYFGFVFNYRFLSTPEFAQLHSEIFTFITSLGIKYFELCVLFNNNWITSKIKYTKGALIYKK
ncbi:MAG: M48 family metalloprotease [Erysipelotrichaceae bacterium]|jgi:hypothetical protein|nr:M48 family metalloprotease [Erysipelotrichaceae bacterium]